MMIMMTMLIKIPLFTLGCELSRIIQESPDFGPYLSVSRLEIWIIAKIAISR